MEQKLDDTSDGSELIPILYREDFETGELNGWASYPPCQDTAYNPYVYPGKIHPDDPGTAFVAMNETHWREDQFLGGIKLLNYVIDRSFSLTFRYYIKTIDVAAALEIHLPLATGERLVYTLKKPPANRWFGVTVSWRELEKHNRLLLKRDNAAITALAIKVRISKTDPDMNAYFAFDDVELRALKPAGFTFSKPSVFTLSEWEERIVGDHFEQSGQMTIEGTLPRSVQRVKLAVTPFTERTRIVYTSDLSKHGDGIWASPELTFDAASFPPGMYRGCITAETGGASPIETPFTFFIVDRSRFERHPRVLFSAGDVERIRTRFSDKRFAPVKDTFLKEAKSYREKVPPESVVYDFDQFPVADWIASLWNWFIDRIMNFREALFTNAVVYSMLGDTVAGDYCRDIMLKLTDFPCWNHPWMENRGLHSYFPMAEMTEAYAFAYDTIYDRLTEEERAKIRTAMIERYLKPTFRTFVEQNRITVNSSNWISHIMGGGLLSLAVLYGDTGDTASLEPWLSGCIFKEYKYMTTVFGADGSYGEGFRYYNFAMHSFARVVPMLDRLFGVDLTPIVDQSFRETLWAGITQNDIIFTFGDSEGYIRGEAQAYWIGGQSGPLNNWAWLVARNRNPHLSWLYHSLKRYDTFEEVIHEVDDVPMEKPDKLPPVAFFREVGTAVFKSGWKGDDFVFAFRSGPFYNHQHMDQGSFYLADHGTIFLEERYDGDHHYYDDPLYQSHAIRTISHNTILINGNPQSQETGDPYKFAAGLNDSAKFSSWLDSGHFAFATGELEGVYSGAVRELHRHILYIKPRTVLIVDRTVPGEKDVEVSSIFHMRRKKDIVVEDTRTEFRRDEASLFMYHLTPANNQRTVKTDPHFLSQFTERPLIERGYLEVSARTVVTPLVMAHLMTAARNGAEPDVTAVKGNGWAGAEITVDGISSLVCVNTAGDTVDCGEFKTDALIVARSLSDNCVFIAKGSYLVRESEIILSSTSPCVASLNIAGKVTALDYHLTEDAELSVAVTSKPSEISVNGALIDTFGFDGASSLATFALPRGEGRVEITCQ